MRIRRLFIFHVWNLIAALCKINVPMRFFVFSFDTKILRIIIKSVDGVNLLLRKYSLINKLK